jgi:hypothetical protein
VKFNKKGAEFATALADYWAAILIVMLVVFFFFLAHIASDQVEFTLKEQEATYGLDATRLGLVFAYSNVETSKGTMSFAEFIVMAAEDERLRGELNTLVNNYFSYYEGNVKKYLTPYGVQSDSGNAGVDIWIKADVDGQKTTLASALNNDHGRQSKVSIMLPLHNPNNYVEIVVEIGLEANLFAQINIG